MASDNLYLTWDSDSEREQVYKQTASNIEAYAGVQKSTAHSYAPRTTYLDIEPNRSVRSGFNRGDYNAFRPGESVPTRQKRLIADCMAAYSKVGIIRNVIDLMSDFAAQGITIVHPNATIEKFYRQWFKEISGLDRTERFLNYLYRTGNVVVQRSTAKISKSQERALKSAIAADTKIQDPKFKAREIPWKYTFLNPLMVDLKQGMETGDPKYVLRLSSNSVKSLLANDNNKNTLSKDMIRRLNSGERTIDLDPNRVDLYFYKKDDWAVWSDPMISAILDDVIMLEKMKLADIAALDGAISNVRLWTVGNLDHKIIPTKAVLQKLRDILASNVGGGTMDMVWGPELTFTESQSQVYRFLGSEKYQPVLTSIYAGMGIPPTLTGAGGQTGGYTNNYVSLKTLIERLEYGRDVIMSFWRKEFKIIQKAMGFRYPAEIHFDSIVLSDEAAMKNLFIQLADRDIISNETLLERFREIPGIEKVRVRREIRDRANEDFAPKKAGPYHSPQHKEEMAKIGLTKDVVDPKKYLEDELGIPSKEPEPQQPSGFPPKKKDQPQSPGRPKQSKDTQKRKEKRVLPRSSDKTVSLLWGIEAQNKIADILSPIITSHFGKKNVRSLAKEETSQLNYLKLCVMSDLAPMEEVTEARVKQALDSGSKPSNEFFDLVRHQRSHFVAANNRQPTNEEFKAIYSSVFSDLYSFSA